MLVPLGFAFFTALSIFVSKHHGLPQGGNTKWKLKSVPKTKQNKIPKNFPQLNQFLPPSLSLSVSSPS